MVSWSTHPWPTINNFCPQLTASARVLTEALLSYCRADICLPAMWAQRRRINETLSDSDGVARVVYLVISPPTFSHIVPFPHWPSLLSPWRPLPLRSTTHTSGVATVTADRCLMPLWQSQRRGAGSAHMQMNAQLHHTGCERLVCYMQRTSRKFHANTHTDPSPAPASEEGGCALLPVSQDHPLHS